MPHLLRPAQAPCQCRQFQSAPNRSDLSASVLLLTQSPSVCLAEMLGGEFVSFLLETLERPPADVSEDTVDLLLTVLLALNLQYALPADNQLLLTLRERDCARVFTEKVMLLFNREGKKFG